MRGRETGERRDVARPWSRVPRRAPCGARCASGDGKRDARTVRAKRAAPGDPAPRVSPCRRARTAREDGRRAKRAGRLATQA
ncbi:cobalt-precorrin-6A reductase [Burkholderia pseudomallei]|nr:cobalt-precorrin-6A reductase [Burkholderia pseudomallei]APZ26850.1 cobalt-precorrin-6A reductase [Burkholderia pseudomallei]KIX58004.1 cobalt-precorrin-6A reductase [Burkholderia pseudomallei]OAB04294.1 cobalt-precorrin-6A reductase [Burkholderia pseudomallei]OMR72480.1 cobalt-precorrin-6A reductase [Burkholderia pseudomallei]